MSVHRQSATNLHYAPWITMQLGTLCPPEHFAAGSLCAQSTVLQDGCTSGPLRPRDTMTLALAVGSRPCDLIRPTLQHYQNFVAAFRIVLLQ